MIFSYFIYDDTLTIRIEGDVLGFSNETELLQTVSTYFHLHTVNCIIDISRVKYMNSRGLSILIRIQNMTKANPGFFVLQRPTRQIGRLLAITKLDQIFLVSNSFNDSLEIIEQRKKIASIL